MTCGLPLNTTEIKSNKQAMNSLVLGIVAFVFAVGNILPGWMSVLSIVSAFAGLFALLSGFSGFRAARKTEGVGKRNAIIGMVLGFLGILALVVTLSISVNKGVNYAKSLETNVEFAGEGYSFSYPSSWTTQDMSGQAFCQQTGVNCAVTLIHPAKDGTNLNLLIMSLNQEFEISELDQLMWAESEASTPGIQLESREEITIGEITAIKRQFSMPAAQNPDGNAYIQQVYITKGLYVYNLTLWCPTTDALLKYSPDADKIISTFKFTK